MQNLVIVGQIIGGLGLFLLAMRMMTEGLKLAGGEVLRTLLGRWTRTPLHGIASGALITALVQSSGAVTIATIGFVNAGMLTLFHALGVVYGANIGTTMTGWLVALIGLRFSIEAFALPLVGIGMFLHVVVGRNRIAAIGEALAGFGLFFIGIAVLKGAFESLSAEFGPELLDASHPMWVFIGLGFVMTVLTQSSSASIAIVLAAAQGGVVPMATAAAMVIGANIGSTSTAALAVIGATPNAKRVAVAHIAFNVFTGGVALLILPVMLDFSAYLRELLGLTNIPAMRLALFHTTFNVLGVLMIWPFTRQLAAFLERRFRTAEEELANPRYLDNTLLATPSLALNAVYLELNRVSAIARDMAKVAISAEARPAAQLEADKFAVENLSTTIGDYLTRLERGKLSDATAEALPKVLRVSQYQLAIAELAMSLGDPRVQLALAAQPELAELGAKFRAMVVHLLAHTDHESADFSLEECDRHIEEIEREYQRFKARLLSAGARKEINIVIMERALVEFSRIRRLAEQAVKAVHYSIEVEGAIKPKAPKEPKAPEPPPAPPAEAAPQ